MKPALKHMTLPVALLALALAAPAEAQTTAVATTDLNIRSGPGPEHPVIGHIQDNRRAEILGCIEGSLWCQVDYRGTRGWAYSQYLEMEADGRRVVLNERPADVRVPAVTYQAPTTGAAIATGAVTGALVGGPVGAVVGGVAGATLVPPGPVTTYVTTNPVDPVYLEGEVVVGAGLPDTIALRPVPDYRYQYVYVNQQPVLVDPATRRIVYVYR
jgi:uncharacterized protein YraI